MAKLENLQQGDFEGILAAMSGLPVVIRLIDPPLHEFLPNLEEQLVKVTRAESTGGASEEDKELLATIKPMHEQNPMLGLRGCRLGLMIPDFVKIQTRAILNAAVAVKKAGKDPRPEIMIPLVGHVNELIETRRLLDAEAHAVVKAAGEEIDFKFGTMIEIPRACWVADKIAEHAEFFSFGTNDLTQMTFGYSRDDAEGGFLLKYVEDRILPYNPFQSLDPVIVDEMEMAVDEGPLDAPRSQGRDLRRARRRPASIHNATRSASTTCPARRSASRSRGSRRRRRCSRRRTTSSPSGRPADLSGGPSAHRNGAGIAGPVRRSRWHHWLPHDRPGLGIPRRGQLRDARGAGEGRAARPGTPRVVPAKVRVPMPVQAPLPRERIEARLADAFGKRLTLVVAPAGSGKTTLLARFATASGAAVAWYRAESWDADEASFVRHLEASLAGAVPGIAGGWASVEDAARDLEAAAGSGGGRCCW